MSNEITAYFKGRIGVAESVYQHDYGILMNFDGIDLPSPFDCYFSNEGDEEAIPAIGADNRVAIPNKCLKASGYFTVHIPVHSGLNDSEVEYIVRVKVINRAKPMDDGTKHDQTAISKAIAALNHNNLPGLIPDIVTEWLDEHPEATTTVVDGAITESKLHDDVRNSIVLNEMTVYVPFKGEDGTAINTGDCTLISCNGKNIIIDFSKSDFYDVLKESIQSTGIDKFDYAVISHYHDDHIGGLSNFLNDPDFDFADCTFYVPPTDLDFSAMTGYNLPSSGDGMTPSQYEARQNACLALINSKANGYIVPTEGSVVDIAADLKMKFFNCDTSKLANYYNITEYNGITKEVCVLNNFSLCCQIYNGDASILLTGDIEHNAQADAYVHIEDNPTIYKIEHHAFNKFTDINWINRINPKYAIIEGGSIIGTNLSNTETGRALKKKNCVFISERTSRNTTIVSNGKTAFLTKLQNDLFSYDAASFVNIDSSTNILNTIDTFEPGIVYFGYISYPSDVEVAGMPFQSGAFYIAFVSNANTAYIEVTHRANGLKVRKIKVEGVWSDWRYLTPVQKTYSVITSSNAAVSPFSFYGDLDLQSEIAKYGNIISTNARPASANPTVTLVAGGKLRAYSAKEATISVDVTFLF